MVATQMTSYQDTSYADLVDMAKRIGKDVENFQEHKENGKRTRHSESGRLDGGDYRNEGSRSQSRKISGNQNANQSEGGQASSQGSVMRRCFKCGDPGHIARFCSKNEEPAKIKCWGCGEWGHAMPQCPRQDDASAAAPGTGLTADGKRALGRVFALGARPPAKASEGINF